MKIPSSRRTDWIVGALLLLPIAVGAVVWKWWPSQASSAGAIIGGIATAEVAILTVAVLLLNRQLVQATAAMADATKVMADATRITAEATRITADATKEVAMASRDEAAASRQQAEATLRSLEELRVDRELQWAPQLVEIGRNRPGDPRSGGGNVRIANGGRGPALRCIYADFYGRDWQWTSPFDLMPEADISVSTQFCPDPPTANEIGGPAPRGTGQLMVCVDRLGHYYRFLPHRPDASDKWRRDGDSPPWVEWYRRAMRVDV